MARIVAFLFLIVAVATINAASPQCGENEEYNECKLLCQPSCKYPIPACPLICIPGCICVEGYARNADYKCIPLYSC